MDKILKISDSAKVNFTKAIMSLEDDMLLKNSMFKETCNCIQVFSVGSEITLKIQNNDQGDFIKTIIVKNEVERNDVEFLIPFNLTNFFYGCSEIKIEKNALIVDGNSLKISEAYNEAYPKFRTKSNFNKVGFKSSMNAKDIKFFKKILKSTLSHNRFVYGIYFNNENDICVTDGKRLALIERPELEKNEFFNEKIIPGRVFKNINSDVSITFYDKEYVINYTEKNIEIEIIGTYLNENFVPYKRVIPSYIESESVKIKKSEWDFKTIKKYLNKEWNKFILNGNEINIENLLIGNYTKKIESSLEGKVGLNANFIDDYISVYGDIELVYNVNDSKNYSCIQSTLYCKNDDAKLLYIVMPMTV